MTWPERYDPLTLAFRDETMIAQQHGSDMSIESDGPDQGTRVAIHLPIDGRA